LQISRLQARLTLSLAQKLRSLAIFAATSGAALNSGAI